MIIFRKDKLEAELSSLRDEWRKQMERALKGVADDAISRLTHDSEALEKQVGTRVAGMGHALVLLRSAAMPGSSLPSSSSRLPKSASMTRRKDSHRRPLR